MLGTAVYVRRWLRAGVEHRSLNCLEYLRFSLDNCDSAMSFTDGNDEHLELEDIMKGNDYSKKRRRSGTNDKQGDALPPLVIKDLSISPTERARRMHTVGLATQDQLTNDFQRDDDIEVCFSKS